MRSHPDNGAEVRLLVVVERPGGGGELAVLEELSPLP